MKTLITAITKNTNKQKEEIFILKCKQYLKKLIELSRYKLSQISMYPLSRRGSFPPISMATMTKFAGTSLVIKTQTGLNRQVRKFFFGITPSRNISGLTFLLNKTFPSPTAEQVLRATVVLYGQKWSLTLLKC